MYQNHNEYSWKPPRKHELLRSWLAGEAGVENLRLWLHNINSEQGS